MDSLDALVACLGALTGHVAVTIDGGALLVESTWDAGPGDGLDEARSRSGLANVLQVAGPGLFSVVDGRIAFLDIETLGLSQDAATLVILVGIGYLEDERLIVRQYFLHGPSAERALLAAVAATSARFGTLITFNGKTFDLPFLLGRFRLHRLPDPLPLGHVDLLYLARRIWRRRLQHSNLATLEARVLGVVRDSDLPGSEIPQRYQDYLHDQRPELIVPILEHNRQDLLSLMLLAARIDLLLADDAPLPSLLPSPSDLLGLGQVYEGIGWRERARGCYEASLVGAGSVDRAEALYRLGMQALRSGEPERAVPLFEAVASSTNERALLAAIELAKIHEHRTGFLDQAVRYTARASELIGLLGPYRRDTRRSEILGDDLDRRAARLARKRQGRTVVRNPVD